MSLPVCPEEENSIRSNIQRHIDRHGRPWRVTQVDGTVYVSPGPELYGATGYEQRGRLSP